VKDQRGQDLRRISGDVTREPANVERWAATATGIPGNRRSAARRVRDGVVLDAVASLAWIENEPDRPAAPERETPGFSERSERGLEVIRGPARRLEKHGRRDAHEDRDEEQDDEHLDEGEAAMPLQTGAWRARPHRGTPPA